MDFGSYLDEARKTAVYPREQALEYLALGLCSEAGEVASRVKKELRDGEFEGGWEPMVLELGDVLWYLTMLAEEFGYSLEEIADRNIEKLRDRQERGQLQGSGDER